MRLALSTVLAQLPQSHTHAKDSITKHNQKDHLRRIHGYQYKNCHHQQHPEKRYFSLYIQILETGISNRAYHQNTSSNREKGGDPREILTRPTGIIPPPDKTHQQRSSSGTGQSLKIAFINNANLGIKARQT